MKTHLSLLRRPLPVRVSIVHNLGGFCISYFDGGVGQGALGAPFEIVAIVFFDEEGTGAPAVAVTIDAFLDGVVHDFAGGDGGYCQVK
jgi:hypothetical protein